jgi:HD-like signal output (HDOD) protein
MQRYVNINNRFTSTQEKKAEKVLAAAVQAMVPAIPHNLRALLALCSNPISSAAELSMVVLNDPGLSVQLLRRGNAAFYSAGCYQIIVMRHILVLLGLENVAKITCSLPLFPVDGPDTQALANEPMGTLLARSALAGALARELASLAAQDPQVVAACAMLRDLGPLLLSIVRPRAARLLWSLRGQRITMERTAKRLVGWRPGQLEVVVAQRWNLPSIIRLSMLRRDVKDRRVHPSTRATVVLCGALHAWLQAAEQRQLSRHQKAARRGELKKAVGAPAPKFVHAVETGLDAFQRANPFLHKRLSDDGLLTRLFI